MKNYLGIISVIYSSNPVSNPVHTVDSEVASAGADGVVTLIGILETLGIACCLAFPRFASSWASP